MQQDRAREAEARIPLPEPEEQAGDEEQHDERRIERGVELLAGVEARLVVRAAAPEPVDVLALEHVELARRPQQAAPVAEHRDDEERGHPADPAPEVDVFDQRPAADLDRQPREVEDQPRREEEKETERVDPVNRPLRLREAPDVARLHAP